MDPHSVFLSVMLSSICLIYIEDRPKTRALNIYKTMRGVGVIKRVYLIFIDFKGLWGNYHWHVRHIHIVVNILLLKLL